MTKNKTAAVDPALIAPLTGVVLGGAAGTLADSLNNKSTLGSKLRAAALGAAAGGGVGGAAEYFAPGVGLGLKYTTQDNVLTPARKALLSAIGRPEKPGNALSEAMHDVYHRGGPRLAEIGSYAFRRWSSLPGLQAMAHLDQETRNMLNTLPLRSKKSAADQKCSCGCGQKVNECTCPASCSCRQKGGSCYGLELKKQADSPAWQRSEGKNPEGGLNAKGRASYKRETGGTLKAPVTESNPSGERAKRQNSFCSRMCGMKRVNTGAGTAKDPDSRINKSLRKWNCKCSSAFSFAEKLAAEVIQPFKKHKRQTAFPKPLQNSTISLDEARAITDAMAVAAPHGALDNTRVNLNGTLVKDMQERMTNNPRLSPLQRWLYRYDSVQGLPDKTQLLPDAYHPHSDDVWLPSGNPGVMMHELGHSIDFNGYPNTTPRMLLAGLYARTAPTLWKEHAAWNKGQQHFLEGAAQNKLPPELVAKTLRDAARGKRMGLSSYWGGGIGSLLGLGGGLALMAANPNAADVRVPLVTASLGGALGGLGGLTFGNYMAEHPHFDSPEATQSYLDQYAQAYAKKHNMSFEEAQSAVERLAENLVAKKKKKDMGQPTARQMAKAAARAVAGMALNPVSRGTLIPSFEQRKLLGHQALAGLLGKPGTQPNIFRPQAPSK